MNDSMIAHMQRREMEFSVDIQCEDIQTYIRKAFLVTPHVAVSMKTISYNYTHHILSGGYRVRFTVTYDEPDTGCPVFLVQNELELTTATFLMHRLHARTVRILIDNHGGFVHSDTCLSMIERIREKFDEVLQMCQLSKWNISYWSVFDDSLYVYILENIYFDSAKETNDMACIAAEHAHRVRASCQGDETEMLYMIQRWFAENVRYKNNDLQSDHSAVGLLRNKTGVCQAIAAYAYQLMTFGGLQARYVSGSGNGSGGWGSHGWNMVLLNGAWQHVDFTFEQNSPREELLKPIEVFRQDHRWDEEAYSPQASIEIAETRRALDHSLIVIIPNMPCYSINGCIIDTSLGHPICITHNRALYMAVFDIISACGGCYELKGSAVRIYIDQFQYAIDLKDMYWCNQAWYCPVSSLQKLRFRVDVSGTKLILQNMN